MGTQPEVPRMVELWYYAVVCSFLAGTSRKETMPGLVAVVRRLVALRMARQPDWRRICNKYTQTMENCMAADSRDMSEELILALERLRENPSSDLHEIEAYLPVGSCKDESL